jgi:UDP-glucose:(heptosyl)LPS alpha-1,3-glucosyltransferase
LNDGPAPSPPRAVALHVGHAVDPMHVVHVVRRYGPVGGMERYVWETTRALAARGAIVEVVCEALHAPPPEGIAVHQVGEIAPRPRWLSLLRFSGRVADWLAAHPGEPSDPVRTAPRLVHSHERLGVHHVTTFHGPPFATIRDRGWWRRVSLRVAAQLWLERRELCGPQVRAVVPNSPMIRDQLERWFPCIGDRMVTPIMPAVTAGPMRIARAVPADGGVIGFVGQEWKRKGLDIALDVVAALKVRRPGLSVLVIGPDPAEVRDRVAAAGVRAECPGWVDSASYFPRMDLLLHPARSEPYGMAVGEAMAARVPVVISDRCGIAGVVSTDAGCVLSLGADVEAWAQACEQQLGREHPPAGFVRSWDTVAAEHEAVYQQVLRVMAGAAAQDRSRSSPERARVRSEARNSSS